MRKKREVTFQNSILCKKFCFQKRARQLLQLRTKVSSASHYGILEKTRKNLHKKLGGKKVGTLQNHYL
jgi:hypothetical protein